MSFEFTDLIDMLDGEEFDEKPVDLKTFVEVQNTLGFQNFPTINTRLSKKVRRSIKSQPLSNYSEKKKEG